MGLIRPDRRAVLLGLAATGLAGRASAEDVTDLDWRDLLPADDQSLPGSLAGLLPHDESSLAARQPMSTGMRTDWNGQIVRLSGFIVPIDYKGTGVTAFILVPYVGACVHVPPPPANQLVFVTTGTPYESAGLFEAVTVTGMFGTASTSTQLAEIGYALSAEDIRPYRA
ncbi:hypothetical protein SAMN05421762_2676 [Pseudooceanicola nitratireducens]|jgi:hypothetical protein|uniref:DUF3299 domain-containing protein n=1 Tax=Pseudooceanicola nitratireducens TaxID=517719 RepID=A0A1I1MZR3_9RHOB|nr:DUF3299 domain-containing protein [Pseudooceanicola nitratireducens]SEI78206.1 hypothetical protein SAMN05216183_101665 [Pseudooceanicola nitratireducens]SFC90382.1 hypothetical protein SAMN05421762_2676 [Pseudooceanicola nitratireducens]